MQGAGTEPPTAEQCSAAEVVEIGGRRGVAFWWPQMGGYVGKAVIFAAEHCCADVAVWHDGEFPFDGTDPDRDPVRIHINPDEWIKLGTTLQAALAKLQ